jgi:glycosyltransferase involved in cell wall biosynthesis
MGIASPTISVCVPTCNRPELLKQALESVLNQTLLPSEVIIGDDSRDDKSQDIVVAIDNPGNVPIRYERNCPSLGQAANINMLFKAATGENLVLLHDDDLLLADALRDLSACWNNHPDLTAAYGKQYIISEAGEIDEGASHRLNCDYFRSERWAGLQDSSPVAGIIQQFPNDCYMIRSSAARAINFRPREEVGNGCEYDFGLRLGLARTGFFFLNKFTAKYRITSESMSKSATDDAAMQAFLLLQYTLVPEAAVWAREFQLKRLAQGAVAQLIRRNRKQEALDILFSRHYPLAKRFHPRGVFQFMKAFTSQSGFIPRRSN